VGLGQVSWSLHRKIRLGLEDFSREGRLHFSSAILRLLEDDFFIPPRTAATFHFFELTG